MRVQQQPHPLAGRCGEGPPIAPEKWKWRAGNRMSDMYFTAPSGETFRSQPQLLAFLQSKPNCPDPSAFCWRVTPHVLKDGPLPGAVKTSNRRKRQPQNMFGVINKKSKVGSLASMSKHLANVPVKPGQTSAATKLALITAKSKKRLTSQRLAGSYNKKAKRGRARLVRSFRNFLVARSSFKWLYDPKVLAWFLEEGKKLNEKTPDEIEDLHRVLVDREPDVSNLCKYTTSVLRVFVRLLRNEEAPPSMGKADLQNLCVNWRCKFKQFWCLLEADRMHPITRDELQAARVLSPCADSKNPQNVNQETGNCHLGPHLYVAGVPNEQEADKVAKDVDSLTTISINDFQIDTTVIKIGDTPVSDTVGTGDGVNHMSLTETSKDENKTIVSSVREEVYREEGKDETIKGVRQGAVVTGTQTEGLRGGANGELDLSSGCVPSESQGTAQKTVDEEQQGADATLVKITGEREGYEGKSTLISGFVANEQEGVAAEITVDGEQQADVTDMIVDGADVRDVTIDGGGHPKGTLVTTGRTKEQAKVECKKEDPTVPRKEHPASTSPSGLQNSGICWCKVCQSDPLFCRGCMCTTCKAAIKPKEDKTVIKCYTCRHVFHMDCVNADGVAKETGFNGNISCQTCSQMVNILPSLQTGLEKTYAESEIAGEHLGTLEGLLTPALQLINSSESTKLHTLEKLVVESHALLAKCSIFPEVKGLLNLMVQDNFEALDSPGTRHDGMEHSQAGPEALEKLDLLEKANLATEDWHRAFEFAKIKRVQLEQVVQEVRLAYNAVLDKAVTAKALHLSAMNVCQSLQNPGGMIKRIATKEQVGMQKKKVQKEVQRLWHVRDSGFENKTITTLSEGISQTTLWLRGLESQRRAISLAQAELHHLESSMEE